MITVNPMYTGDDEPPCETQQKNTTVAFPKQKASSDLDDSNAKLDDSSANLDNSTAKLEPKASIKKLPWPIVIKAKSALDASDILRGVYRSLPTNSVAIKTDDQAMVLYPNRSADETVIEMNPQSSIPDNSRVQALAEPPRQSTIIETCPSCPPLKHIVYTILAFICFFAILGDMMHGEKSFIMPGIYKLLAIFSRFIAGNALLSLAIIYFSGIFVVFFCAIMRIKSCDGTVY